GGLAGISDAASRRPAGRERHLTQPRILLGGEGVLVRVRTYLFPGVLRGLRDLGSQPPLRNRPRRSRSSPGVVVGLILARPARPPRRPAAAPGGAVGRPAAAARPRSTARRP